MWNDAAQRMPRGELEARQLTRLQHLVSLLYARVPFYRDRMNMLRVTPEDIHTLEDIALLPFTSKDDMRAGYPFGLFAVDPAEIVEVHMSSGTTGMPVVDGYTRGDLAVWGDVMARTLDMGGVGRDDIVQVAFGYGLFTGGFGVHQGAQSLGAMVLPVSSGNTARQLQTMQDFGTTALACTPSYAVYMAEHARDAGIDIRSLPLRVGFFGSEPWTEPMRADLQEKWDIRAYDIYGLTELIGPGVGAECPQQDGLHIAEDVFYPEVLDPDTGAPLPAGETGELVLTAIGREGSPLLRYRTRDITYLMDEPCACGRTSRRIHRLMGRNDDMLIIRGVNIFPQQVEKVLHQIQGMDTHYQLVVEREGALDTLRVEVEMSDSMFSDEVRVIMAHERRIETDLKAALGVQAKCVLVNPRTLARFEGKANRVIDRRETTNAR
ncbi:MAG TPA: phenylacetate--CoA ligase [Actinomycetaceae bacterium]|nr:phenylacetate--CoA ligase [Actinomycetaceae bacterium]